MNLPRRRLLQYGAASAAILGFPASVSAKRTPQKGKKVVICGGGFAGLSVAKHLKQRNPDTDVTVIEQKQLFISCPLSNVWLGDEKEVAFRQLVFSYHGPAQKYGYEVVNAVITGFDRQKQLVHTTKGTVAYDYLVLSPGIGYDYSKLTKDASKAAKIRRFCPPAMQASGEHLLIKEVLRDFTGGNFIISLPSGVYRCPPGPYERACMVANYFKNNNIDAKVVVLDPREKPATKAKGFLEAFEGIYKDYVRYIPNATINDVNLDEKSVDITVFDKDSFSMKEERIAYAFANIIPENTASPMIKLAGIEHVAAGWATIEEPGFRSVSDDKVYVVGDAINSQYPKSAHMANSCAKLAAKDLAYRCAGKTYDPYSDTPSNICFSMVQTRPKKGIVVHHWVEYEDKQINIEAKESNEISKETGGSIKDWYKGLIADIFE